MEKLDIKETTDRLRAKIDSLKSSLTGQVIPEHVDDLYLLRFLLSHKEDVAEAEVWILKAEQYRKDNASWLEAANPPHEEEATRVFVALPPGTAKDGAPIFAARPGKTLQNLRKEKDPYRVLDMIRNWMVYKKEQMYKKSDALSRASGKLTKIFMILDMTDMPMWMDPRVARHMGESTKISEAIHPQLAYKNVMVHPPAFMSVFFNFMKPFMSRNTVEKMVIVRKNQPLDSHPLIKERIGAENLPLEVRG